MPRVPFRSYSFHGGAGAILSVGLLNAVNYTELEMCVHATKAPGQPLPAAVPPPLAALRMRWQLARQRISCSAPAFLSAPQRRALTKRVMFASCCCQLLLGLTLDSLTESPGDSKISDACCTLPVDLLTLPPASLPLEMLP